MIILLNKRCISLIRICIIFILYPICNVATAMQDIQFNTDVLDVKDRGNIDLSQFSRSGFIMPGSYSMSVKINKTELPETTINFLTPSDDPKGSEACLSPKLVGKLGLKENLLSKLKWDHGGKCLDMHSLKGIEARGDLANSTLYVNIPQAWLEYTSDSWDPPSRWDDGIPGVLFDYNLNLQTRKDYRANSGNTYSFSGNGTTGFNIDAWRFRADWQSQYQHQNSSYNNTSSQFKWSRYYAWRAIRSLRSRLSIGEDYLTSDIFDGIRFTGGSIRSDDTMLPPNLRGYAPEVTGIAKTNARVVITQQDRVLYDTQVAAGPFRIQDLSEAVSGEIKVRVEEQDGSIQEFIMNTASIPYLTRPGQVRYKVAVGRPTNWQHHTNGDLFTTGEFSWGINSGWSLYGGGISSKYYQSLAFGFGRDLMALGAISLDTTQSHARITSFAENNDEKNLSGRSYRVSYSKNFDELDSQITFAGYRFSEKNYMSMSEFLDARTSNGPQIGRSKEMYTITMNKNFRDAGLTLAMNYNHQTYWDLPDNDHYSLTLSSYFDLWSLRNLSVSAQAYRSQYNNRTNDGIYISLSVPLGSGTLSYSSSLTQGDHSNEIGYYGRLNDRDNYQLRAGNTHRGTSLKGYFNHNGDLLRSSVNVDYSPNQYRSVGMTAQGGGTLTPEGGALHRTNSNGGTRLLVDTDGVANVPVRGYGNIMRSNTFGKAILPEVNNYYRNLARIDLSQLDDDAEAIKSVVQVSLTEGAIGYRKFDVISGRKTMAVIRMKDGSAPPFGASVRNSRGQETGLIGDQGNVYLSGINPGEKMIVNLDGKKQCEIEIPLTFSEKNTMANLLLPCKM